MPFTKYLRLFDVRLDAGAALQPGVRLLKANYVSARSLYLSSSASPMRRPSGPRM